MRALRELYRESSYSLVHCHELWLKFTRAFLWSSVSGYGCWILLVRVLALEILPSFENISFTLIQVWWLTHLGLRKR